MGDASLKNRWPGYHATGALIVLLCFVVGFVAALAQPAPRSEGFLNRAFGIAVSGPVFLSFMIPQLTFYAVVVGGLVLCSLLMSRVARHGSRFVIVAYLLIGLYWAVLMNLTVYIDRVGLAH